MKSILIARTFCDACGKSFHVRIQERKLDIGIIETYFDCPYCGTHTNVTVTDPEMRTKIQRRKQLRKEYKKAFKNRVSEEYLRDLLEQDTRLKNELIADAKALKDKYHLQ